MTSYTESNVPDASTRNNSFDLLRLVFALFVLYSHTFVIGSFGKDPLSIYSGGTESFGSLGVMGFFIISGYLVTQSIIYSKTLFSYGIKRFMRLYPGFWVNLIVTGFVFAPFIYLIEKGSLSGFNVAFPDGPLNYLLSNFSTLMHTYTIGNLLSENPLKYTFNGSLWTLFLEVKAYIALGMLFLFGFKRRRVIFPVIYTALTILIISGITINSALNKFVRLLIDPAFLVYSTYFFAGATYYLYKKEIPLTKPLFTVMIFATAISIFFGVLKEFAPISIPFIVVWSAFNLPQTKLSLLGKYSYGLYIYAFPIQQIVTLLGFNTNIVLYLVICFIFTLMFSLFSWYLVESPSIVVARRLSSQFKTLKISSW